MKKLYIIKTGTTFKDTLVKYGDFDKWTFEALGIDKKHVEVIDIVNGSPLPYSQECAGVIVTGSHSYVTEKPDWSVRVENWIPSLIEAGIPFFGICYGHQLLANALGGKVGFHPDGEEIGTVDIHLLPECSDDPVFSSLPKQLPVHVTHEQTVLSLPPGAVRLAENSFERNHAFRVGKFAWGVQFHPEYNIEIINSYIHNQAVTLEAAGRNIDEILNSVKDTFYAAKILQNFADFALNNF